MSVLGGVVVFLYPPGTHVKIRFLDLNYHGRTTRAILDVGDVSMYRVEYADDKGDIQAREFFEDELGLWA